MIIFQLLLINFISLSMSTMPQRLIDERKYRMINRINHVK